MERPLLKPELIECLLHTGRLVEFITFIVELIITSLVLPIALSFFELSVRFLKSCSYLVDYSLSVILSFAKSVKHNADTTEAAFTGLAGAIAFAISGV